MASTLPLSPPRRHGARPAPARADTTRLKVVTRTASPRRLDRRRARLVVVFGVLAFAGALFVVAVSQAMVASEQVRLDNLNAQVVTAAATNENLQLTKAELASPVRILQIAEKRLGMITPTDVVYLSPIDPGPSLAHVTATPKS